MYQSSLDMPRGTSHPPPGNLLWPMAGNTEMGGQTEQDHEVMPLQRAAGICSIVQITSFPAGLHPHVSFECTHILNSVNSSFQISVLRLVIKIQLSFHLQLKCLISPWGTQKDNTTGDPCSLQPLQMCIITLGNIHHSMNLILHIPRNTSTVTIHTRRSMNQQFAVKCPHCAWRVVKCQLQGGKYNAEILIIPNGQ